MRLCVTKADLVSSVAASAIEATARRLNPRAPIYRVENGLIAPERILAAPMVIDRESVSCSRALRISSSSSDGE
jgi:G3E family GTPase